jgi:hypothetical protein
MCNQVMRNSNEANFVLATFMDYIYESTREVIREEGSMTIETLVDTVDGLIREANWNTDDYYEVLRVLQIKDFSDIVNEETVELDNIAFWYLTKYVVDRTSFVENMEKYMKEVEEEWEEDEE